MSLTKLELERLARIEANRQRMQQIGLTETVAQIAAGQQQERQQRRAESTASVAARKAVRAARRARSDCPRRWVVPLFRSEPKDCNGGAGLAPAAQGARSIPRL